MLVIACNLSAPFGAPCTDFGLDTAEDRTVTDATNKLYFFELATTPDVIWVDLNWLDFKAGAPVMTLDPNNIAVSSDVTDKFTPACAPY